MRISFPRQVNEDLLERLLDRHFQESLSSELVTEFDLSRTEWCDLLCLSLITLWIKQLLELGKSLRVIAPRSDKATKTNDFLRNYSFVALLHDWKIDNDFPEGLKTGPGRYISGGSPTLPLTFLDETRFGALLSDLQSPDRLKLVLREMALADVVQSGTIRNVVLAEIGSNFFDHALGRFAHFAMTTSGAVPQDKKHIRVAKQLRATSEAQHAFFKALNGEPYLTLVLSDLGPGIPDHIRETFLGNPANSAVPQPTSAQLLQYAFGYHSTSRSIEERLGTILQRLVADADDEPSVPPTGLYQLRSVMREFRGLLEVRTASAVLVEDFLSDPPTTFAANKSSQTLGGTQYKLLFPFRVARPKRGAHSLQLDHQKKFKFLSLVPRDPSVRPSNDEETTKLFSELYQATAFALVEARKEGRALLVDAKGVDVLSGKLLFYLLLLLMEQEPPFQYTVIVNAPTSLPDILATNKQNVQPILAFDDKWVPRPIGLPDEDLQLFLTLIANPTCLSDEALAFARRFPHWFRSERSSVREIKGFTFLPTESWLKECTRNEYALRLREILLDETQGFYFPHQKVLLPSRSYCHGYFDISKFVASSRVSHMLRSWVSYTCTQHSPDYLVTIGANAAEITEGISTTVKSLHVETPTRPNRLFQIASEISAAHGRRVVVVTDVIGTGESLKNVLRSLGRSEIVALLAVVNATQQGESALLFEGKKYDLEALLPHSFKYFSSLPSSWDYDEVSQVDPITHALIPKFPPPRPDVGDYRGLWGNENAINADELPHSLLLTNQFLEQVLLPAGAVLEGQFASDSAHMLHLFNIPKIVMAYGHDIADRIQTDVLAYFKGFAHPPTITNIAYPEYNAGLNELAALVCARFTGCLPVPLSRHVLREQLTTAITLGPSVIFLDDALFSGNTVFGMLDLAEASGVEHTLIYTLVRRGDVKTTNKVRKIKRYGRSSVAIREIAAVEMPVFRPDECPACKRRFLLEEMQRDLSAASTLRPLLTADIASLMHVSPDLACKEAAGLIGEEINNTADRFRIRWMLAVGTDRTFHKFRNHIAEVVRAYLNTISSTETSKSFEASSAARLVLNLFIVISRERSHLLETANIRDDLFYPTFAEDIAKAAANLTKTLSALTYEQIEGVLAVFSSFDPLEFLNQLPLLLNEHLSNTRISWLILRECFLAHEINKWPDRISSALLVARQSTKESGPTVIDDALDFWQRKIDTKTDGRSTFDAYRRLTGPGVHDLTKYIEKLEFDLTSKNSSLMADWTIAGNSLTAFLGDISLFRRGIIDPSGSDELCKRIQEFEINLKAAGELIRQIEPGSNIGDSEMKSLSGRLRRMHTLIDSTKLEKGIRLLLEEFRTNLVDPLRQVIGEFRAVFPEDRITWEVTGQSPLVFGLSFDIYTAIKNVVVNAIGAGATALFIRIKVESLAKILLHLFDDGRGLSDNTNFHDGLQIVQGIASAYCGAFELRSSSPSDEVDFSQFKTVAILTFSYSPERRTSNE